MTKKSKNKEDFATTASKHSRRMRFPKKAANSTFQDWKNLLADVLACADVTDFERKLKNEGIGLAYIYGMAMKEENPPLFNALTKVVMRHIDFHERLNNKKMHDQYDEPHVAKQKKALDRHLNKITFKDLCDSNQYGMRGKVRQLIGEFKEAMTSVGTSLSEVEKRRVDVFIKRIEAISQSNYRSAPISEVTQHVDREPQPEKAKPREPAFA